jgi:hypothetical protein
MDEAMNWLRNNEVKPSDIDGRARALTTISGVPLHTINMLSPEEEKATDDAMSWLRNNDPGRR